jgi:hypothetical protein
LRFVGAGGQEAVVYAGDLDANRDYLFDSFALTKNYFRESVPLDAVMIHARKNAVAL